MKVFRRRPPACGSATRRPTRWAWSTTPTTSSGSRLRGPTSCGRSAGATGKWNCPACRCRSSKRSASTCARRGTTTRSRSGPTGRMLSPVRMEFNYEVRLDRGGDGRGDGPDDACVGRSRRVVPAACRSASGRPSREGIGHRRRRLHRIAPDGSASGSRRGRRRHRLFHRLLSAGDQAGQSRRQLRAAGISLRRSRAAVDRSCGAPRRRRPMCFTSRRRPASARAGATIFASIPTTTSTQRSVCSRHASAVGCKFVYASSSSVYGDNVTLPMREDALPQPVSPYGVTKLAAEQLCYLYHANHGCRPRRCDTSPSTGRGSVLTWRFIVSFVRRSAREHHALRRRRADARLHVRDRRRGGDDRCRRARRRGTCLQHRRRIARLGQSAVRHHRPHPRPAAGHPAGARTEGRHARHLRRHIAGARGPGLLRRKSASNRGWSGSISGWPARRRWL